MFTLATLVRARCTKIGPKRIESRRYLYSHPHSSVVHNGQKAEAAQMSPDRWARKHSVVGTYSRVPLSLWALMFSGFLTWLASALPPKPYISELWSPSLGLLTHSVCTEANQGEKHGVLETPREPTGGFCAGCSPAIAIVNKGPAFFCSTGPPVREPALHRP